MESGCDHLSLWPQRGCGYGGYCDLNTSLCVCYENYIDRGDYQLRPGRSCNSPKILIRFLVYAASVCLSGLLVYRLYLLVSTILMVKKRKRVGGSLFSNKLVLEQMVGLVNDVSQAAGVIYKATDPFVILAGENLFGSFFYSINPLLWWFYLWCVVYRLQMTSIKIFSIGDNANELKQKVGYQMRIMLIKFLFTTLNYGAISTFGLYIMGPEYDTFFVTWHCFSFCAVLIAGNNNAQKIFGFFTEAIDVVLQSAKAVDDDNCAGTNDNAAYVEKLTKLKGHIKEGKKLWWSVVIQNVCLFTLMGTWPLMRSYFPVFQVFEPLSGCIGMIQFHVMLPNPSKQNKNASYSNKSKSSKSKGSSSSKNYKDPKIHPIGSTEN